MPLNREVVCVEILHIFPISDFEVFSEILENVPKFWIGTRRSKGTLGFWLGFWPGVDLGFSKVVRGVVRSVISTNHHWAKTRGVTQMLNRASQPLIHTDETDDAPLDPPPPSPCGVQLLSPVAELLRRRGATLLQQLVGVAVTTTLIARRGVLRRCASGTMEGEMQMQLVLLETSPVGGDAEYCVRKANVNLPLQNASPCWS
jgi:hypothetical protein